VRKSVTSAGLAVLAVAYLSAACSGGAPTGAATPPATAVTLNDELGSHHHAISTPVDAAQQFFDQGVRLTYAFNYAEAILAYEEAARLDPACALCWWGVAWAAGPSINAARDAEGGSRAYAAIVEAETRLDGASEKERAYIEAMALRYGADPMADWAGRDSAYAEAMVELAHDYPDDEDAQVLAAEALMMLSPWDYWEADGAPYPVTEILLDLLRGVTETNRDHAGACHFYIHAVEKAHPERAVPCAERIAALMPGAGHVVHMPAHVFIRVGRYADAIEANEHAIHADEAFYAEGMPAGTAYTLALHPHNHHFLSFAAGMAGQRTMALTAARHLAEATDREMMREPGFGALQHYLVTPLRAMVRFGLWDEIIAEPAPPEDLPYAMGTWHYARGMAFARSGQTDAADDERAALLASLAVSSLERVSVWDLNAASALLAVGERLLTGEIAAARGAYDEAIAVLEEGVRLETALTYDEPPPWHLPVRHVLGAVLLEAERPTEAETVYHQALERFPENGWALFGLLQSLETQGNADAADAVRTRLGTAWRTADVDLVASRF
jgi:tetratricopeptide (TPR) repeat protein